MSVETSLSKLKQNSLYSILFLWVITFPFRNSVLTFSIKGAEIYPNFLVTIALVGFIFCFLRPNFKKTDKIYFGIVMMFLIYCILWILLNGLKFYALFDLHSMLMSVSYAYIIFSLAATFGWDQAKQLLSKLLIFCISVLVFFGIYEMITEVHIMGSNVSKLMEYPISSTFNAPFFIYDNQNDYCLYLFLSVHLLLIVNERFRSQKWIYLLLLLLILLFGWLAQARLVMLISTAFVGFFAVYHFLRSAPFITMRNNWKFILAFVFLIGCLFLSNDFFKGSDYRNSYKSILQRSYFVDSTGSLRTYKQIDLESKKEIDESFKKLKIAPDESRSDRIRYNLLQNGLMMITSHPILGVGPGQFNYILSTSETPYPIAEVYNPHNFVIEVIAQYGLLGWVYFGFMLYLIVVLFQLKFDDPYLKAMLLLLLFLYPIIGLIPSSFSYINLHWLFLPVIVCIYNNQKAAIEK